MRLERSAYLLLLYCDQVDLPILLSVSSAVVLVISEANQSCFPCQPHGCVSHITPNDVWLFLFIHVRYAIILHKTELPRNRDINIIYTNVIGLS